MFRQDTVGPIYANWLSNFIRDVFHCAVLAHHLIPRTINYAATASEEVKQCNIFPMY